ncbi:MAG: TonB-dependent receptor plug domain-containing protein [Chitinivibrionales bacterium]|nr:TonB-dependent receptor plug domain-containing protein [Chitinivibrionales bacterium]
MPKPICADSMFSAVFLILLLPLMIYAETIRGTVTRSRNDSPCIAALVYLEDTDIWTHTDLRGQFILENIPPGTYTLAISLSGYKEARVEDILVAAGAASRFQISLYKSGPTAEEGGFIHGKVINERTGDPIEKVVVFIEGTDFKAVSDSLGKYRIPFIPEGTYTLIGTRRGFESVSIADIAIAPRNVVQKRINLTPARRRFGAYVEQEDVPSGILAGEVIDFKTRRPVAAANVYVKGTSSWAYTDANGHFALSDVPAGNRVVAISLTGYADTEINDVTIAEDSTTDLTIYLRDEGGDQSLEDLENIKFGSISGTVADEKSGEPLVGVPVFLEGTDFKTQSDSAGTYTLDSIPEGTYTMISLHKGYDAFAATGIELATGEDKELNIGLMPRSLDNTDMEAWFSRPGIISGRVVSIYDDTPVEGVRVFLRGTNFRDTTDADGFYALEEVLPTPGDYVLCGTKEGYDTLCKREINVLPEDMSVHNFAVETAGPKSDEAIDENRGTLTGNVVSQETGEAVVGAHAILEGTGQRGMTDFKGVFRITRIRPGTYSLAVTQEGFATSTLQDITVEKGRETNVSIEMATSDVEEMQRMVVKSTAARSSGAVLLKERQDAISFTDAIGAQEISRTGASDAADAMKSVTGASVVGGKYVLIRGLPERYTITMLNGSPIPSPDPDKKAVNMDLFPAGMIENITTYKTFAPDLPGNFAGGVVDIETKPFPEKFILSASASLGYQHGTSLSKNYLTYDGGDLDWLGIDDGSRELPELFNSYTKDELDQYTTAFSYNLNSSKYAPRLADPDDKLSDTITVINTLAKSLDTTFTPYKETAPMDQSYSLTLGNTFQVADRPLGFIIGANYGNKYDFSKDIPQREYFFEKWQDTLENEPGGYETNYQIIEGENTIAWGILCNAAYKLSPRHKFNVDYMYTRNASDRAKNITGFFQYYKESGDFNTYRLHYTERSLNYIQPAGKHRFTIGAQPVELSWRGSLTKSTQTEPDLRNIAYFTGDEGARTPYSLEANLGEPSHKWRDLNENAASAAFDLRLPFYQWSDDSATLSAGGLWFGKKRRRRQEFIEYQLRTYVGANTQLPPEQYFRPDSIGLKSDSSWGITFLSYSNQQAQWDGNLNVYNIYGMVDLPIVNKLSTTAGVRYEVTDMLGGSIFEEYRDSTIATMNDHDILPSVSLNYKMIETMNIRCAYGRTLVRPSMREKAQYKTEAFSGGPSYQGNRQLKRSLVDNADIRWEWFMNPGELLTASGFYKVIHKPIELTFLDETNDITTHKNTQSDADIVGIEFEGRKKLGDFQVAGNLTLAYSLVKLKDDTSSRGTSKKSPLYFPDEPESRPFQGQSPYVGNIFLSYDNHDIGLNLNLLYNVFGERLGELTKSTLPWIWEKPQHMVNFTAGITVFRHFSIKGKIKNILGTRKKFVYHYNDKDYTVEAEDIGRTFSLGIRYSF